MLGITSDTVLDIRADRWPVTTVGELDLRLNRITTDVSDHRVRPVEVGLDDDTDITARGLFIGIGGSTSYAVYHSRAGNDFITTGPCSETTSAGRPVVIEVRTPDIRGRRSERGRRAGTPRVRPA